MKRFITNGDFMYIHRNNRYSAKKIFSLLISFVFCSSLILNMAPSVLASPTLDGVKDEGQYTETNKFVAVKPANTPTLTNGQQANIYYTWNDCYVYLYAEYSQNTALIAGKQQMTLWINSSPSKDATKKNASGNLTTLMGGSGGTCMSNSTTDFNITVSTSGTSSMYTTNEKKATALGTYFSSKSADNKKLMLEVRVPRESGETQFSFGFEATDWSSTFVRYLSTNTTGSGDPVVLTTLFDFGTPLFISIDAIKDDKYSEETKFAAVKPDSAHIKIDGIKDGNIYTEANKFVAVKPANTPTLTNGQQANIYYTWDDSFMYLYAEYSQNTALIAGKQQMTLWINSSPSKDATKKNASGNLTTIMGGSGGTCMSNSTTDISVTVSTSGTSSMYATNEKKVTTAGTYVSSKSADNKKLMLEVIVPRESGESEFSFGFEATDWSSTFVRYLSTNTTGGGDPVVLTTLFKFACNPLLSLTNGRKADIYYAWNDSYVYLYAEHSQNTEMLSTQSMKLWINSSPSKDATKKNASGNLTKSIADSVLNDTNTDFCIQVNWDGTSLINATTAKQTAVAGTYMSSKSTDNKSLIVEVRVPRESGESEFSFGFEANDNSNGSTVRYLSTWALADGNPVVLNSLFKFKFDTMFAKLDGIKDENIYTQANKLVAVKPSTTPELTNGQNAEIYYFWNKKYVYLYLQYNQSTEILSTQSMKLWINSSPSKDATKKNASGNPTTSIADSVLNDTNTDFCVQVNWDGA